MRPCASPYLHFFCSSQVTFKRSLLPERDFYVLNIMLTMLKPRRNASPSTLKMLASVSHAHRSRSRLHEHMFSYSVLNTYLLDLLRRNINSRLALLRLPNLRKPSPPVLKKASSFSPKVCFGEVHSSPLIHWLYYLS